MKPDDLRSKLHGVISFPVTPFKPDYSLDLDVLRSNLRALLKHPVCAIVPAAGTGELFSLTPVEHLQVIADDQEHPVCDPVAATDFLFGCLGNSRRFVPQQVRTDAAWSVHQMSGNIL